MNRDLIIYVTLLCVGLGSAYYVSLPQEVSSEEVSWVKIDPNAISQVQYKMKDKEVVAVRQSTADGFWVTVTEPGKEPGDEARVTEFRANDKMKNLLDWFNPLYAKREVGSKSSVDLKEFELDVDNGYLKILTGEKTAVDMQMGRRAYGSRNYFIMDKAKEKIILVTGSQIETLEKAKNRMIERKLHGVDPKEIAKVILKVGDNAKTLDHSQKNGSGQWVWSDEGTKEEKPLYKNIMTKFGKLRVKNYGTLEERQTLNALIPVAEMEVHNRAGGDPTTVRVVKQSGEKPTFWVWSSFLGEFAMIDAKLAQNLVQDLPGIVLSN